MIEHYWRVRGVPGAKDYDQVVHRVFQRHNLRLPLTCAGNTSTRVIYVILLVPSSYVCVHLFSYNF